jgi:DNA primase large subunit
LKLAYSFHAPHWKLVNRFVNNGYVLMSKTEYARLLQIEVNNYVYEKTLEPVPVEAVPDSFRKAADEIVGVWSKLEAGKLGYIPLKERTDTPPCISRMIKRMENGENASHFERLVVATFMIARNRNIDEIIEFFSKQPDYKYSVTKYQVEHLAGLRGGGKKYSVPSCRTILTNGLCYPAEYCKGVRHPLRYGEKDVAGKPRVS